MKKYFFMAIAAITTIAFVSCEQKPTPTPTEDAKVVLDQHELELAVGDQAKLRATITPANSNVTATFKSENAEIATVTAAGLVEGIAAGTVNIIASAEGAKADTCVVTVIDKSDAFAWVGCLLWNLDKGQRISTDTTLVTLRSGLEVHCYSVYGQYRVWGKGLTFTGSNLAGAGSMAIFEVPVLIIADSIDENGPDYYYVGSSLEVVPAEAYDPTKAANAYQAPVGQLVSLDQHILWWNDDTGEVEPGIDGQWIYWADFDNSRFYWFDGLFGESILDGDQYEVYYKCNIGWSDGAYGFALNEDGTDIAKPEAFANYEYHYYENLPAEDEAPRMMAPVQHAPDALDKAIATKKVMDKFYILK